MKLKLMTSIIGLTLGLGIPAWANHEPGHQEKERGETLGEKTAATGRSAKRAAKKGYHRTKELVCMKGDLECAAQKAKHRTIEAKDATVDKAKEIKDEVD